MYSNISFRVSFLLLLYDQKLQSVAPIQTVVKVEDVLNAVPAPKDSFTNQQQEQEQQQQQQENQEETTPRPTRKQRKELLADAPEKLARTLFVGNVPVATATDRKQARQFKGLFAPFGPVESVRFRSIAFEQPGARRVAFVKGEFRKNCSTCNAYVVMGTREAALAAMSRLNATMFAERHLRVDLADANDAQSTRMNTKKSIFIGNLSMEIEEEPVWRFFEQFGQVTNVRLIRDRVSNLGKGIGYVTFASRDSVELALKVAGSTLEGRPVRISRCCKAGMVEKKKERLARLAEEKEKRRKALVKPTETSVTAASASSAAVLGAAKAETATADKVPAKKLNKKEAKLQAELATKFGQLLHKKFPFNAAISSLDSKKQVVNADKADKAKTVKSDKADKTVKTVKDAKVVKPSSSKTAKKVSSSKKAESQ